MSSSRSILVVAMVFALAASLHADPKPLSKAEQAKVDKAIDKGVAYLKKVQKEDGAWANKLMIPLANERFLIGQTILSAYALLEAGVPAKDPVIQKAADYIRPRILQSEKTYEIALGVLFFDRLGNPKDKKKIQSLALRLIAGQHRTGGWNYRCPTLREKEETALLKVLDGLTKLLKSGESLTAKSLKTLSIPRELKPLTVFQVKKVTKWVEPHGSDFSHHNQLFNGTTDNSNTQFAMLGLWVAQRYDISARPTFQLMVDRFANTQQEDGGWRYDLEFYQRNSRTPRSIRSLTSRSMICVGLMGMAIGCGLKPTPAKKNPFEGENHRVLSGLSALAQEIGIPSGQMDKPILFQESKVYLLYFLWSVERVAMLYNLPTIDDKDWYRWGAELLVVNQKADGEWHWSTGPIVGTSFALLFLKRSHPMKDLTPKLPFTAADLNKGIAQLRKSDSRLERSITTPSRSQKPDR